MCVFVENRFDCEGKVTEEREETKQNLESKRHEGTSVAISMCQRNEQTNQKINCKPRNEKVKKKMATFIPLYTLYQVSYA